MPGARPFEKVLVVCPRGLETGGPEALHQLVDSLRRQGQDAYLVPLPGTEDRPRIAAYDHYDAPELGWADEPGTAVVVPEAHLVLLGRLSHATRFVWWLSADFAPVFNADWPVRDPWRQVSDVAPPAEYGLTIDLEQLESATHVAQSQYAWSYLFTRLGIDAGTLSDYTRAERFGATPLPPAERGRTVAYNAAKCGAIVRMVAEQLPDVDFVPLQDMSADEVAAELGRAAVYLDLGFHPGKDRLPREAALAGALVVVARRGAGAYAADVPIPAEHKVRADEHMVTSAAEAVRTLLGDLDAQVARQDGYRAAVRRERELFDEEVRLAFLSGTRRGDAAQAEPAAAPSAASSPASEPGAASGPDAAIDLDVVLLSVGGAAAANAALARLAATCPLPAGASVTVVLSGAISDDADEIELADPATDALVVPIELLGHAADQVVARGSAAWVLVLSDDVALEAGWLESTLAGASEGGEILAPVVAGAPLGGSPMSEGRGVCLLVPGPVARGRTVPVVRRVDAVELARLATR